MLEANRKHPLSLTPLSFDEAVTDILKVKPEPKRPKSTTKTSPRPKNRGRSES